MQYARSYPALPPVANPMGQQALRHDAAPAIKQGTPIDESNVNCVIDECHKRDALAHKGLVTYEEVFAAHKREIAVLAEHLAASGPPGERLDSIAADLMNKSIECHNDCTADMNRLMFLKAQNPQIYHALPLVPMKTHEQLGAGTPGVRHLVNQVPQVPVGQMIPSPPFPRTLAAMDSMTMQDVDQLAMLMHRDFGIAEGDDLLVRRHKVLLFLAAGSKSGRENTTMEGMLDGLF